MGQKSARLPLTHHDAFTAAYPVLPWDTQWIGEELIMDGNAPEPLDRSCRALEDHPGLRGHYTLSERLLIADRRSFESLMETKSGLALSDFRLRT
ncbi:uncharacterized protein N7459_001824 [Penicillium hispanicum]|uniref:uncharacterized protein n=1 Tax=Penicillium hispanicum TaxID=1080232 RepID=UPI0025420719|nr:uncharacterized protein N7459_001824 [Penicillium hispanicum]KAJ5591455.1 hypothetical protein N7459_001824 [Penicillium hispanicum]